MALETFFQQPIKAKKTKDVALKEGKGDFIDD